MFNPSLEQLAFFSELTTGSSSILLSAVAGSGKTSTIVHSTQLLPPHVLTVFLAFNKRIADELETRVPRHVQVNTFHSRAFRALSRSLPKLKVDKDKVHNILLDAKKRKLLSFSEYQTYSQFVKRLVGYAKNAGLGTDLADLNEDTLSELVDYNAMTLDEGTVGRALAITERVLLESNADLSTVDFDDMLYLALLRKVPFDKASFLFVDEAQDTNAVQRALLSAMLGPSSRLIAVGDARQAIYGFRGASSSAMEELRVAFNMKELPLSVSWRCSKAVVKEAQKYFTL